MAAFITFEGGEGSGKSLQARRLYRALTRAGRPALLLHEPGGTPLGERVGRLLKWTREVEVSPVSEVLLFNVSRHQLVESVIRPALQDGQVVICDRFADSTVAYQGYGRGLDPRLVTTINEVATAGLKPDLTVLLDMPVPEGLARISHRQRDRFEGEDVSFHERVRAGYLEMARAEPERWLVVDSQQPKQRVAAVVRRRVERLLAGEA